MASKKREREDDIPLESGSPTAAKGQDEQQSGSGSTSNFRNVSACNRCRTRKNRCDQKLPRCTGCEKANVKCVGFDPVSKRTIPRSYVYYLETRVNNLEALLQVHSIRFEPPEDDFSISDTIKPGQNVPFPVQDDGDHSLSGTVPAYDNASVLDPALKEHAGFKERNDIEKLDKLVSDVGMVSVQGTSESRYLGSTSGISFARVVFAAVKSSVSHTPSERGGTKSKQLASESASGGGTSMRDSFFGLHTKPAIKPAPFPEKTVGQRLVELYFEHANPQIPVLHRGEFMSLFERVYATDAKKRSPRELYLLNIVFAIGSGIIMDSANIDQNVSATESAMDAEPPSKKRQRTKTQQHQPEEYHSSAVVHLESFLGSSPTAEGGGGGLEELQAVLLLAGLALLRPVAPGLWYIIGVAVRLAVDLGLHFEEIDDRLDSQAAFGESQGTKAAGRKQWTRDLRRRLWWCVYTFDRLVSTCVGRPFGITDQVVTTEFPSLLDDKYITTNGFLRPPPGSVLPSYKLVAHHYFRLRLLQSEILQVLQHRQAESARMMGANRENAYIHKNLASPFLQTFSSFREWRSDVDRRLWDWKESAPKQFETGVAFTPLFLELNYWQAIIMLYRQSLAVPEPLAGEISPSTGGDVQSPGTVNLEAKEDEQMVFMKVAQAGQMVLKTYRQLHRLKLVNYTFLATHHLFMSGAFLQSRSRSSPLLMLHPGISFLYAIWHSTLVRSQLSLDDVDFTVLIAISVLSDLTEKCPPAEACRDAFVRMSKATIAMCEKTTGFGNASTLSSQPLNSLGGYFSRTNSMQQPATIEPEQPKAKTSRRKMTMPKFDMNLKDLFSDEEIANRPLTHQTKLHGFGRNQQTDATSFKPQTLDMGHQQQQPTAYTWSTPSPQSSAGAQLQLPFDANAAEQQSSPHPSFPTLSNQLPYQPLANTISHSQPDFSFDDMSFLDTFPVADPTTQSGWGGWGAGASDLDVSFGTGGTGGYDSNGEWDLNSFDMLGGLFFGGDGGAGTGY